MYVLLIVFLILFVLTGIKVILILKETFAIPEYLRHKSKCFDCENEVIAKYGPQSAWLANPTKGFDDEKDVVLRNNGDISSGYLAKTIKYY